MTKLLRREAAERTHDPQDVEGNTLPNQYPWGSLMRRCNWRHWYNGTQLRDRCYAGRSGRLVSLNVAPAQQVACGTTASPSIAVGDGDATRLASVKL